MGIPFKYLLPSLCLILTLPEAILGQQREIDSLNRYLKNVPADSNRAGALNFLSYLCENTGSYERSDSLAREALKLSLNISYRKGIAIAYTNMASYCDDKNDLNNALQYYQKALSIKQRIGDKRGMANTLNGIGLIYEKKADYFQAMGYYFEALKICREAGDSSRSANALSNIGNVYQKQSEFPKALQSEFAALRIREQLGDTNGMATSFEVIGNCYSNMKNYARADDYYNRSLRIKQREGDLPEVASLSLNIGLVYESLGSQAKALELYNRALDIYQKTGDSLGTALCFNQIGENYHKQRQYDMALDYCTRGLNLFKRIGYMQGIASSYQDIGACYAFQKKYKLAEDFENKAIAVAGGIGVLQVILTANYVLSNMYDSAGQPQKSLDFYKKYIVFRDSVYNTANTNKSVQAEMSFEFDRKLDKEKFEEDKRSALAEQQKKRDLIIRYSLLGGFVLVLALAFLIFNGYRDKANANKLITSQKVLVEQKNKDILSSITYAKHLQDAMLPPLSEVKERFPESFILHKPKDIVAGDFYWLWSERTSRHDSQGGTAEQTVLIAAADCTGHGVPGAMVSVVCSNALDRAVKEFHITDPGKILDKVRELVVETFEKSKSEVKDGMDISLVSVTRRAGAEDSVQIKWAGAYNPLWYYKPGRGQNEKGELVEVAPDKQPIGKTYNPKPFTTQTINLESSGPEGGKYCGILYLFTDGYADQFGGPLGKKLKYKPMQELVLANAHKPLEEQGKILNETLEAWKGTLDQVDDILILGIKV